MPPKQWSASACGATRWCSAWSSRPRLRAGSRPRRCANARGYTTSTWFPDVGWATPADDAAAVSEALFRVRWGLGSLCQSPVFGRSFECRAVFRAARIHTGDSSKTYGHTGLVLGEEDPSPL